MFGTGKKCEVNKEGDLFSEWENEIGFTGTGMPKGGSGKRIHKMGLGYINQKKVNAIITGPTIDPESGGPAHTRTCLTQS